MKDAFDRSFPPVLFYMSYLQIINRDDKCTVLFVGRRCIVSSDFGVPRKWNKASYVDGAFFL